MPKVVDHEQYREELIWACYGVFADHGFARCTMKELAVAAGVTPGTLYHYFPDKLTLFQCVVRTIAETDLREWERIITRVDGLSARLGELGDYIDRNEVYFARQYRIWREVATYLDQAGDFSQELRELYARYLAVLGLVFEDAATANFRRERLVIFLASVVDGLTFHRQLDPTHPTFRELFETFAQMLGAPQ